MQMGLWSVNSQAVFCVLAEVVSGPAEIAADAATPTQKQLHSVGITAIKVCVVLLRVFLTDGL